ncbi:hypothetical protein [Neptuniibacter sp. 1_MG-2023]|uniref:hypothetical protein n=1 Tax=Neptuniibacter sp. 1_MG-2023 TaxID=3062662 RepID=UPI0026E1BFEF|nr:hypothetical protein [Neptuniibacter sp. 1_MG-2023]MDO6593985.1 hypothetical protein [Neptuniibacter sp. 1_MG-2023]
MKSCEKCVETIKNSQGYPSPEQLNELGKEGVKPWCDICKQLLAANYRISKTCDAPRQLFNSRHFSTKNGQVPFTRFDV